MPVPVAVVQQFVLDFAAHACPGTSIWGSALPPEIDALLVQLGFKAAPGPWALKGRDARRRTRRRAPLEAASLLPRRGRSCT
jgi:hypothetical protein